tara:strand:+ start:281 stop:571 length:291 start_codon:yes stop_codon:yes gene_type:complete
MTSSSPSASSLSAAITELEQALSALDQTVITVSQSLSENAVPNPQGLSAGTGDMMPIGQVRKELAALQELVSGAVELIALARSGNSSDVAGQQEIH